MKKHLLICALTLVLILTLGMLSGCDLPFDLPFGDSGNTGGGGDEWKPSGADVTIIKKNTPITYIILYGEPATLANAAASDLKEAIADAKLGVINATYSASAMNEKKEIIIGSSDRTASIKAKEVYDKDKAELYSWAFCYYDGKLAIYAESDKAYELAFHDLLERFVSGDKLLVKDTLCECVNMTEAEYDEYIDAIDRAEAEKNKKQHEKYLEDLEQDLASQRTELGGDYRFNIAFATKDLLSLVPAHKRWGEAPYTPIDEHPRVMFNKDDIPAIRKALREDNATNDYFFQLLETHYDGVLKPAPAYVEGKSCLNYDASGLEKIAVKALAYQLYDDPYYGYQAIFAMKNYLKTIDIKYQGDQYRQFGDIAYTVARVYDWCYDLLTEEDKNQLIAGSEKILFNYSNHYGSSFEVGFPPTEQTSFVGHGAEYQILRDYLSFSIAIYDENPTWYNYVGARFYNDFVPNRNCYFEPTGIAHQGTNYLTLRHLANIFSAWLSISGMGVDPYVNLLETVQSFAAYEYAPGYIFTDGDGTSKQNTSKFRDAEFMAGYLYDDPNLIALAEITLGSGAVKYATQGLGVSTYTIIRGKGVKPTEDPYANMDPIRYNGAPLGQYVIRDVWNSVDAASVFMKLKERHTSNHEHPDSGSFQIYYKGMLTSEGGVYENYGHSHTVNYLKQSVSHNTLLIRDHRVTNIYYTGGQKSFATPTSAEHWMTPAFICGEITGNEHGYFDAEMRSPHYAYLAGDITKSYTETTVSYVGRRMLTVYTGDEDFPMAFFVYDDISSKNVAFKKTFLLQITSPEEPDISNKKQTVITENGEGRLVLTCLTEGVTIEGIGGRVYTNGKYDPEKSSNYLVNGKQLVSLNKSDDGHWGRVEISLTGEVDNTFMNVIYVTDKGQKKDAPEISAIKADGVEGSTFGNLAAVFMTSRERADSAVSFTAKGDGEMKYYVSGVTAGEWNISVNGKDCGSATATEAGGLLVFTAPAGEVTLTPSK